MLHINTKIHNNKRKGKLKLSQSAEIIMLCLVISFSVIITSTSMISEKQPINTEKSTEKVSTPPTVNKAMPRVLNVPPTEKAEKIPVLLYNDIVENDSDIAVSKKTFEEQMLYLKKNGYTTVSFDEFIDAYDGKINLPKKSVLVTFNTGVRNLKMFVNPFLIIEHLNATAFVVGIQTGDPDEYLDRRDIKNIQIDKRFDIESQSYHFYDKTGVDILSQKNDTQFQADNKKMESLIRHKVRAFSYPNGKITDNSINLLKNADIRFGFLSNPYSNEAVSLNANKTNQSGKVQNSLLLPRITIQPNISIEEFRSKIGDESV